MSTSTQFAAAQKFIKFVNTSPTPYHAVRNAAARLEKAGFTKLLETEADWDSALKGGGRFYYVRYGAVLEFHYTCHHNWFPETKALLLLLPSQATSSPEMVYPSLEPTLTRQI